MSPKQELQAHPRFNQFASMLNSPDMDFALRTAMLTFTENLPEVGDEPAAIAAHWQLVGAKKFARYLKHLAELPAERKPNTIGQLKQL